MSNFPNVNPRNARHLAFKRLANIYQISNESGEFEIVSLSDFEDVRGYEDEYEESEEEEDYEDEEEGDQVRVKSDAARKKAPAKKSIFDVFEPIELERGHFTDR